VTTTKIKTPLYQDDYALDPATQAMLMLSDQVHWSFDVLTARRGGKQRVLGCSDGNALYVDSPSGGLEELLGQLTGTDKGDSPLWEGGLSLAKEVNNVDSNIVALRGRLMSTNDLITMANYYDSTLHPEPLYDSTDGISIADHLRQISVYLGLVVSLGDGWVKVHETT